MLLCLLLVSLSSTGQQAAAPKAGLHGFQRTGAGFLRECSPPDVPSPEATHIGEECMVYVLGVADGAAALANRNRTQLPYCLTPEVDALHLDAAVSAYIKTNADRADARTPDLILEALSGFWPCHPDKK